MRPLKTTGCTTMAVGKKASATGSTIITHSNDDELSSHAIVYVPEQHHKIGTKRNVYASAVAIGEYPIWNCFLTPQLNLCEQSERGTDYVNPDKTVPKSIPIGSIPQVEHTYGYLDGDYGICNTEGLSFGECTNGTKFQCGPTDDEDKGTGKVKRLFYSTELSRVALERCANCRDAINLMGSLIDEYGYYGTGETLPLADGNEQWVFEMSPSKDGIGGYWVAQRVPDDHFWIGVNEFTIRDIKRGGIDDNMIVGNKIFDDFGTDELDWAKTV